MTIVKQIENLDFRNTNGQAEKLYMPDATKDLMLLHKEDFDCEDGTQIKRVMTKRNDGNRRELNLFYNSLKKTGRYNVLEMLEEKYGKEYVNGWESPIGYAKWQWFINILDKIAGANTSKVDWETHSFLTQEERNEVKHQFSNHLEEHFRYDNICEQSMVARQFLRNKAQPIYVERDIAEAFMNTEITNLEAKQDVPLPTSVFMLPKDLKIEYFTERDIEYCMKTVALVVISNEEYRKSIQIFQNERENSVGTLTDEEKCLLDESFYDKDDAKSNMFKDGYRVLIITNQTVFDLAEFTWEKGTKNLITYDNMISKESFFRQIKEMKDRGGSCPCCGEEYTVHSDNYYWKDYKKNRSEEYQKLINLAANAILILNNYEEHVTIKSPGVARGFGESNSLAQPSKWIGENYKKKVRYEYPEDHVPSKGVAKRPHWRKGHWRNIYQGIGRKQKQLRFIEPVYVNKSRVFTLQGA